MCFRLTAQRQQNYNKPAPVSCNFEVGKADEDKVQIEEVNGKIYGDDPFALVLTGQKGTGAVKFSVLTEMEFWSYQK